MAPLLRYVSLISLVGLSTASPAPQLSGGRGGASPAAGPAGPAGAACTEIKAALPREVFYGQDKAYQDEQLDYWNAGNSDLKPACITRPTRKESVATIVKILNKYPTVKFAVKSGGHDANDGHSSIGPEGVLIALSQIRGTTYDARTRTALVKPGGNWGPDVVSPLDKLGRAVVGGRLGIVGIGGYLTQGGMSYLSGQYGLAADSVLEFETVLANGTIATITRENNPDLMQAMRGGGSQYGIVTQFKLKTYPMGKIWGGIRLYGANQKKELYEALHSYMDAQERNQNSAIIFTATPGSSYNIFYFYNGQGSMPPNGTFGGLEGIKPQLDVTGITEYSTFLGSIPPHTNFHLSQIRTSFWSMTFPYIKNGPELFSAVEDAYLATAKQVQGPNPKVSGTLALQSFPASLGKHSAAAGGNAMGYGPTDGPRWVLEMAHLWEGRENDQIVVDVGKALMKTLTASRDQSIRDARGQAETYLPFFMNDAADADNVFASYKDYAKFKVLQKQVDPTGLWSRSGGWKLN
ncbi:FAD-binding domain-containing protein [Aulographum hederae CBS 113979]|uniref:FAD-binding domain-containing protein n=1 Tax=Aulographum hederae CBS 113979 TaxID=1176131 RepID=A0A6G1HCY4_9PEZI|nr:FAD-binding domain-containing protein [Aulographum hederae CBS 113979]